MGQHVLLSVGTVGKAAVTSWKLALERFLTSVNSSVDLEVFHPCKDLSTSRVVTDEGFLTGMDPDMVDQFVFGFEWL